MLTTLFKNSSYQIKNGVFLYVRRVISEENTLGNLHPRAISIFFTNEFLPFAISANNLFDLIKKLKRY